MSVFAGIKANKNAKKVARGIIERGEADARLRRIRAEQLFGQIRDSSVKRGFRSTSVSTEDNERQAALLEGADIDRIKFRAEVEAHAAKMQGHAALVQSIGSTVGMVMSSIQFGMQFGEYWDSIPGSTPGGAAAGTILNPGTNQPQIPVPSHAFEDAIQLGPLPQRRTFDGSNPSNLSGRPSRTRWV